MRNNASHGDSEHGMHRGEGRVYVVMTPKIPVAIAFPRPLASRGELHWRINQERVHEGFHLKPSRLFQMFIVGLDPISPRKCESSSRAPQGNIRKISVDVHVPARQMPLDAAIGG